MKRLILFMTVLLGSVQMILAQCTPNTAIGQAYLHPEKIGDAQVGYDYYQVLTFRVPHDSDILYNGNMVHATVDSAQVVFIGGIPSGYGYVCSPARCTWPGGTLGCALLSGKTVVNDSARVGEYPIKLYVQTWFHVGSLKMNRVDSSSGYTFRIVKYNGEFRVSETKPLTVFPNPSDGLFNIELRDLQSDQNLIQVYGLDGKLVYEKQFGKPVQYLNSIEVNIGNESKGVYMVRLQSGDQVYRQKISIN